MSTQKINTFLMFTGQAEEAMTLYTSLFEDSNIVTLQRHGEEAGEMAGKVLHATFTLNGQTFVAIDSPPVHAFSFTPSMSLFVNATSEAEIDRLFAALSDGGSVMMPLGEYPFAKKFAWTNDRFGVSWQLSLPLTL